MRHTLYKVLLIFFLSVFSCQIIANPFNFNNRDKYKPPILAPKKKLKLIIIKEKSGERICMINGIKYKVGENVKELGLILKIKYDRIIIKKITGQVISLIIN